MFGVEKSRKKNRPLLVFSAERFEISISAKVRQSKIARKTKIIAFDVVRFFFVSTLLTSTANLAAMTFIHTVVGREERERERERKNNAFFKLVRQIKIANRMFWCET